MAKQTKHFMQPARSVVDMLGGGRAVARELGISPSTVSRWTMPKSRQNLGGRIPQVHWLSLIAMATKQGKELTLDQLLGSEVAKTAT
jgi:DNA-binding transcriptional regulator YdaS (Cro superfamily)